MAAAGALVAVVLAFQVFAGDQPHGPAQVPQSAAGQTLSGSPTVSPTPTPSVRLPATPASRSMVIHPGPGTNVASYVIDNKSGLSYARYGSPWKNLDLATFPFAQRAGSAGLPQALIGSRPMPGVTPPKLATSADYRRVATKAARWTLRYQPAEGKLTWTASQPLRRGMGWMLGYKISYLVDGNRHTSEAIVAVVGNGRKKPALLFGTVPDTRKELFRDLNMLYWTITPL